MRIFLLAAAFIFFPASLSADENESLFLKIYLPRIGVVDLSGISVSVIPSPMVKIPDQPGEANVIPEEYKEATQYSRAAWEALRKRQWLALEIKNPPTIELNIAEIPVLRPGYSYSVYVSPSPENAFTFGRMVGPDLLDILFQYYTVNIAAAEVLRLETRREALQELRKNKSRVKLRAKLIRIETAALDLFSPDTKMIDFLDFYISDIEFLNPVRNPKQKNFN